jgi:hypothetical protein
MATTIELENEFKANQDKIAKLYRAFLEHKISQKCFNQEFKRLEDIEDEISSKIFNLNPDQY